MVSYMKKIKCYLLNFLMMADRFFRTVVAVYSRPNKNAFDLSIVAIIKNEGLYIEEWIKYHITVGIQKFYLYDNGSTDNTKDILKRYIDAGFVDLISYPGKAKQLPAYNDALKKHKKDSLYMAIIDGDEFLLSCDRHKNVVEQVKSIFSENPKAGGIAVNWRMFGSSGFITRPYGGGY